MMMKASEVSFGYKECVQDEFAGFMESVYNDKCGSVALEGDQL